MAKAKRTAPTKEAKPRGTAPNARTEASASKSDAEKERRARSTTSNRKLDELERDRESSDDHFLTTNQGLRMEDDQNSLRAGVRGPTLIEDFHLREKITHFDHERIPERIVHARGSAAHGIFRVYDDSMKRFTKARFLTDPSRETPVFVRFSTVAGSRGSSDLARDVRGFATKFYTDEGNVDLVGNNIPVFFIQDALKFPDLIHAVKPEPHNEVPQAASAHDTFWDFISLMPEAMHMVMWVMSDRAIPRSLRMMEGFGVHTFRFVNEAGKSCFVKFHWKPLQGMHSVVWDEAQKISGKDPDFHRRDLWDAIAGGDFPEWELGVQIVPEADEHKFDFDILDSTKLIPEELVPVRRIGKMTLNRNPDNFFAETEQVAFHLGHIVPGIDFSDDPLLQGRLFSYLDTQLKRLGGPNFNEIPINRPVAPVHNLQRDGQMRQTINEGRVAYEPNTLGGGCPFQAGSKSGGFVSHPEALAGTKVRGARSEKFFDHFTQALQFFRSQSAPEQEHIIQALQFELGHCGTVAVRERMVAMLSQVDMGLAQRVAEGLGMKKIPRISGPLNMSFPADANPRDWQPKPVNRNVETSPATSMLLTPNKPEPNIRTRKVAILVAEGSDPADIDAMKKALMAEGAMPRLVGRHVGAFSGADGAPMNAEFSILTASSVFFDAVYVAGGDAAIAALMNEPAAIEFLQDAFKHYKPIAASGAGVKLLDAAGITNAKAHPEAGPDADPLAGVVTSKTRGRSFAAGFIAAIAAHRHWSRGLKPPLPRPVVE
ncbi:MAG: catalase [Thermoanaerobaculia bacterium]|jgi:catalase|nr:catalase [Thermoanaerobaculia bacterium]